MDVSPQSERLVHWATVFSCIAMVLLLRFLLENTRAVMAAGLALAAVFSFLLVGQVENWRAAGDIAQEITSSARALLPARRLFLLSLPDNINGAYIYRNGFPESLKMNGYPPVEELVIMTRPNLYEREDDTWVRANGERLTVGLTSRVGEKERFNMAVGQLNREASRTFDFDPKSWKDNEITLTLTSHQPKDRFAIYQNGKLTEIFPFSGRASR